MKQAVLVRRGSAGRAFELREAPDPLPGPGQVRIAVEYSGLNFADVLARLGLYPEAPPLPAVLGYDVVGRVDRLGAEVKGLREGDSVVALTRFGGYASSVIAPALAVAKLGDGAAFADRAAATAIATQYCTAWFCAEDRVSIHPGDVVVVSAAAGGVGQALVQLAKRRGARVIGVTRSAAKAALIRSLGADEVVVTSEGALGDLLKAACGSQGADIVFDSLGGDFFSTGLKLLAGGGRLVSFGVAEMAGEKKSLLRSVRTLASFGWPHPLSLLTASKAVIGVNMLRLADERPGAIAQSLLGVVAAIASGALKLSPARVFPAQQVGEAHDWLGSGRSTGKVALSWV